MRYIAVLDRHSSNLSQIYVYYILIKTVSHYGIIMQGYQYYNSTKLEI